ncbi:MAG: ABC transporter substrate-binding protein [Rhodospirillales bacterium]|nr:MAG: ABC transporter substrate-binding protein [Rhodospirillales bacterium]
MRNRLLSIASGVLVAAAAAMAPIAAPAQSTLRIVMHSDLKILDPVWASAQISRAHGYMVYDTLYALDADLKPRPQMVETHSVDAAGTLHTFTLRAGLAWHDGAPVTAEDCVASLRRWGGKDSMGQKLFAQIEELVAVDARTIRMKLRRPYGMVLETLAKPGGTVPFMMPKRVADTPFTQQIKDPVGSGPFIFKADEWRPGARVVYVRNPAYAPRAEAPSGLAGAKVVKLDRVEWVAIVDQQTAVNALQNGEVDVVEAVTHELLPLLEKDKSVTVLRGALPGQYALRPNWLHPPFDNPKIREALGYALDQTPFLEAAVGDPRYYRVCKTYFLCDTPLASDAGTAGRLSGDAAKARELLKEAGYDGRPIILLQVTDIASLTNLAPVAKAQLERAGFKVEMLSMDWQTHLARALRRDPPDQRGWNIILSSSGGLAGEIQARALTVGTHFPLGEWYSASVVSVRTTGWVRPPAATVFWNVEKSGR